MIELTYKKYPSEWTPATVEENQQRVINDIREIFGIRDICVSSKLTCSSIGFSELPQKEGMSYMAQQKAIYAKAYERWSDEDDQKLLSLYAKGKTVSELMQIFKRNRGAIESRIKKLTQ